MIFATKLKDRLIEKIDAEDRRAVEFMSEGNLTNFAEYKYSAGYRKALRDVKTLLEETFEDIMKE